MMFGRSRPWLSLVFVDTINYLSDRYRSMLFWDRRRLALDKLRQYAVSVENAGGVARIWGFIDGTQRQICRPSTMDQRVFYSGHKKSHTIQFQAIVTPDGLVSHLGGPFEGTAGDWKMWRETGVEEVLRELMGELAAEDQVVLYGDPAYTNSFGITGAYRASRGRPLTDHQKAANTHMSTLRAAVEDGFGKTMNLWRANGDKANMKIGVSPIAAQFIVSVLLTNIHTCWNGSQVGDFYDMSPCSVEEYLGVST